MERIGFYHDGKPTPGIIEAQSLAPNKRTDKWIKYNAVVNKDKLNVTAIFELSGSPCIYFKRLDQSEPTAQ